MKQLEAIWEDSDTHWDFDFEHRNLTQTNMEEAFNAQAELLFQMQKLECQQMLKDADASVKHMEDIVKKYEDQVNKHDLKH